ncbi:serine hydrolase [Polycladomyces subterraneus]|uniref:Serine hydrolase n=1 Tax=Polycladomyces subterraneus TaxID=1016997 RepID=A0ABT8IKP6_9BACL|nr:serine hydrolase [Polycladomyces subterraneus]MDN4593329.1 serine hydrolase [Polycladomyces subterraneus]
MLHRWWKRACSILVGLSLLLPLPAQAHQPDRVNTPFTWEHPAPFAPVLHPATPESVGMRKTSLDDVDAFIQQSIADRVMPGAVVLVARSGGVVKHTAYGDAARYLDDKGTVMEHPLPMRPNTIFDLASISKIFTVVAAMKLYEQGKFHLDDPVARYLPEFAQNGKEKVTIRQLMTHTSGFRPGPLTPLYKVPGSREDRLRYVLTHPLDHEPGTTYVYSDLNLITLGALVERLSGERLDQFVREQITAPLGMKDTMYNPPAELKDRIAATEYQPWTGRGLVWGQVHDENAWALGGVAGHAGVFSTARDLAVLGQMILNKGAYGGKRILRPETVKLMEDNQNEAFPGQDHGLGWELNQHWYMDALASPRTMGHTGYTGTSLVVDRANGVIAILLTNRVHPTRQTVSTNPVRRQFARFVADAIPVNLPGKEEAWFSGYGDNLDRLLTSGKLDPSEQPHTLSFSTWYRIQPDLDKGVVEVSADGTNWTAIDSPISGSGEWRRITLTLPAQTRYVRFRYHTDTYGNGRGWYVQNPVVTDENGKVIPLEWSSDEWKLRGY